MTIQAGQTASAADILKAHKSDGNLEFDSPSTLTISGGAITATQNYHLVDTESSAASDDLDTINGGTDGFVLVIAPANDARTVVIKHNTGNIKVVGDESITLDDAHDAAILIYSATLSKWTAGVLKGYDTHIAASTAVHGLPANVNALGNRTAAGEFIQRGSGYVTGNGSDTFGSKAVTFSVTFSTLACVIITGATAGQLANRDLTWTIASESTTGFTAYAQRVDGVALAASNYGFYWIAIGT